MYSDAKVVVIGRQDVEGYRQGIIPSQKVLRVFGPAASMRIARGSAPVHRPIQSDRVDNLHLRALTSCIAPRC
jgi:hypothetical protein